ncbi:MAG: polysaccharide biosynthesis C-terminal domain-containing protein, partial [Methanobacteriaceae archaeon]|nr:polysaccharide biosynthesis C-terminal domain-containing protein [Methanobacteriaceae archaeon]
MNLKKSILKVFSVNLLTMISGIIISFLAPSILSIESYADLKTFTFYLSYTAFLSIGFVDGMYIKYGGIDSKEVNIDEFKMEHTVFLIIEFVFTILLLIFSIILKNDILFLLSLSIIPVAMVGFFNMFYQATGQFDKYSKNMLINTSMNLILNFILVIVLKIKNAQLYCLITIITNTIIMIYLEYVYAKKFKNIK